MINVINLLVYVGSLQLNWQQLQQSGQQHLEEANQFLASIPPDRLLEVF